jgi:hypothetical protein
VTIKKELRDYLFIRTALLFFALSDEDYRLTSTLVVIMMRMFVHIKNATELMKIID